VSCICPFCLRRRRLSLTAGLVHAYIAFCSAISSFLFLDVVVRCSGQGNAADSKEFDDMMKYVTDPAGCRHAFLTRSFSSNSQTVDGVHTLCHGGCDVCDLRVDARHDLSGAFCRPMLLQCRGVGLPKAELLKRCMATPRNQVWQYMISVAEAKPESSCN
jgi:hypothetical protein